MPVARPPLRLARLSASVRTVALRRHRPAREAGITLIEVTLVVIVLSLVVGMAVPHFGVAVEQTRVDAGASALRSVWLAERMWWLEQHAFCDSLEDLVDGRLLDGGLVQQSLPFTLELADADAVSFTASLARSGSTAWTGSLDIDESGDVTGFTQNAAGLHVSPTTH